MVSRLLMASAVRCGFEKCLHRHAMHYVMCLSCPFLCVVHILLTFGVIVSFGPRNDVSRNRQSVVLLAIIPQILFA